MVCAGSKPAGGAEGRDDRGALAISPQRVWVAASGYRRPPRRCDADARFSCSFILLSFLSQKEQKKRHRCHNVTDPFLNRRMGVTCLDTGVEDRCTGETHSHPHSEEQDQSIARSLMRRRPVPGSQSSSMTSIPSARRAVRKRRSVAPTVLGDAGTLASPGSSWPRRYRI